MSRSSAAPVAIGIGVGAVALAGLALALSSPRARTEARRVGALVTDTVTDWMDTLLNETSKHEGSYWSVQRNLDGQGVSYGILQWTQKGGGLFDVLIAMRVADPAQFDAAFGGSASAGRLIAQVQVKSLGPVDGANLWDPPWLARFDAAGRVPAFQAAQRDLAKRGEYMKGAIAIAKLLGVSSERALVICYNRTVHQGVEGATGPARRLVQLYASGTHPRPGSEVQVLAEYGWLCAAKFRRATAPPSDRYNDTIRWVQVAPGTGELNLKLVGTQRVALVREVPPGPVWHGVTGSWDLWDLILNRTYQHLVDPNLRDVPVAFNA